MTFPSPTPCSLSLKKLLLTCTWCPESWRQRRDLAAPRPRVAHLMLISCSPDTTRASNYRGNGQLSSLLRQVEGGGGGLTCENTYLPAAPCSIDIHDTPHRDRDSITCICDFFPLEYVTLRISLLMVFLVDKESEFTLDKGIPVWLEEPKVFTCMCKIFIDNVEILNKLHTVSPNIEENVPIHHSDYFRVPVCSPSSGPYARV